MCITFLSILLVQQYGEKSSVFGVFPSTVNHGLYTSRHTFNQLVNAPLTDITPFFLQCSSSRFDGWTSQLLTARSRASHACSIGLQSGGNAGHGNWSICCCRRKSCTTRARCGGALSCWSRTFLLKRCLAYGISSVCNSCRYLSPLTEFCSTTKSVFPPWWIPPQTWTEPPPAMTVPTTVLPEPFTLLSPHTDSFVRAMKQKPGFIGIDYMTPMS